ncbi:MAG TPA: hypothetical protein PL048_14570 [Leptospiraceae bacterium]|nr:hypothetical protein [Leptospiraceae bacterium]HMZ59999.1 hypothetical protein [Leptospiraceae bacterium]HNF16465.1 hypothetical protein [Leptospiraceae bacterium]HNF27028.1 hypothetical protein [Leptospiraceae bacterium]HNI94773.1 hypothetical protein [Leptospiraceae bacterium]
MKRILPGALLMLPTLLFAADMGGIFFVILWVFLGYQSLYNILTGLIILLFLKKGAYSAVPKTFVYIFLTLGIISGGALLVTVTGLCFEPVFWKDAYLLSFLMLALSIITGWFQISRGRLYLKTADSK